MSEVTFTPRPASDFTGLTNHTIVIKIRKVDGKYVADPLNVAPPQSRRSNIVFVMEGCPPNAKFLKIVMREVPTEFSSEDRPFFEAHPQRVMLLIDDNSKEMHWRRKFMYDLKVMEGTQEFIVDPEIDNDPPGTT